MGAKRENKAWGWVRFPEATKDGPSEATEETRGQRILTSLKTFIPTFHDLILKFCYKTLTCT